MNTEKQLLWEEALRQQPLGMVVNVVGSMGLGWIFLDKEPLFFTIWLISSLVCTALRAIVFLKFSSVVHSPNTPYLDFYKRLLEVSIVLCCLNWSVLSWHTIATYEQWESYIVLMTIASMAGGVATTQASVFVGKVYIVTMLAPVVIQLARSPALTENILSGMSAVYCIALLISHEKNYRFLRAYMRQTLENTGLIAALSAKSDELKAHNRDLEFKVLERTAELTLQAHRDYLTNLLNRRGVLNCDEDIKRQYLGSTIYAAYIDLDQFKEINAELGHQYGDIVLQRTARAIETYSRITSKAMHWQRSLVSRWGGDEFVVIVVSKATESRPLLQALSKDLLRAIDLQHEVNFRTVHITGSLGLAQQTLTSDSNLENLLADAAIALHHAKQQSRNCWHLYDNALRDNTYRLQKINAALAHACVDDTLSLCFQPIVDAHTHAIHSYEALLRWKHAQLGDIAPSEFIPLAEANHLILEIGQWVLEQCCAHIAQLTQPIRIAINVSTRQLAQADFAQQVADTLQRYQVSAQSLVIELTESAMADNTLQQTRSTVQALQHMGFEVHLDDFGTGYSSLSRLHQFPITAIKLDKDFLQDWGEQSPALVEGTVLMLHRMGIRVIAEGVETEQQAQRLRNLGVDELQGFWFAYPSPLPTLLQTA
ncbi:EAL domain-containing protein [Curvibacter sp. CHRR-16]|uniref:putative bifunctional diguanylate cyclase/phosphodiesterase n=1 Tax=Curvibacter sp. CHRR-16 TaxID=2835872 RepID=UPI001BDB4081|nr:GGDEF domain-containing phosphodiesterase [Curvibacter sp. CHRR-16]MBT0570084.1 EAL domain-containing protein [Curvibacter sp. CHRR-16]